MTEDIELAALPDECWKKRRPRNFEQFNSIQTIYSSEKLEPCLPRESFDFSQSVLMWKYTYTHMYSISYNYTSYFNMHGVYRGPKVQTISNRKKKTFATFSTTQMQTLNHLGLITHVFLLALSASHEYIFAWLSPHCFNSFWFSRFL